MAGVQRLPVSYFDNHRKNQVSATLPRTAGGPIDDYLGVGTAGGNTPTRTSLARGAMDGHQSLCAWLLLRCAKWVRS
jgi:hypothetical protein